MDFMGFNDRPEKPRRYGVTEIRGPYHSVLGPQFIQDILETTGLYVDGLKFSGGSTSLMPKGFLRAITEIAHNNGVYVSTGGWAEHVLTKGPNSFKKYISDCRDVGFDSVDLSASFFNHREEELLRLIRLVKNAGLKAKTEFEIPVRDRHEAIIEQVVSPAKAHAELSDIDVLIRKAERCLEAGADMILFEVDSMTKNTKSWQADYIAKLIGRLGLEKIMFEANEPEDLEWFVKNYGSKVNLFVNHSHVTKLECLRSGKPGTSSDCGWDGFSITRF